VGGLKEEYPCLKGAPLMEKHYKAITTQLNKNGVIKVQKAYSKQTKVAIYSLQMGQVADKTTSARREESDLWGRLQKKKKPLLGG